MHCWRKIKMLNKKKKNELEFSKGQILIYKTDDGQVKLQVRLEDETVWLTQQLIADLFQTTVPNISMHIRNVYEEGELTSEATVKEFLTVRQEGKRQVKRLLEYYNLDMIISVGYRVKSHGTAIKKAHEEYEKFRIQQLEQPTEVEKHFIEVEKELKLLESEIKQKSSRKGK